jgi:Restriction endonuclease
MGVDLSEKGGASDTPAPEPKPSWAKQLATGLRELQPAQPILYGVGSGLLMTFALLDPNSIFALLAGIIPVTAGLLLVRGVKGHFALHGFVTGLIGALVSLVTLAVIMFATPLGPQLAAAGTGGPISQEFLVRGALPALMLLVFCTFGASTSGRMELRNRELREQMNERGGQLERPGTIRTADDIRGLSLPQLGSYVNALFKKKGFTFKDYRFIDKDKHLDLWMEREGEPWHLRLSVGDKITPGTIESLLQEMKRANCRKGVVIASTEFTAGALKAAKDRPVVLIDGATLYEIAEG